MLSECTHTREERPAVTTIDKELALLDEVRGYDLSLEARTPSYCAGCPHRGTSSVMIELRRRLADADYMRRTHASEPFDIIAHGGIGCYSLNFLPPFRDMHNMAAMGLGGAAGLGAHAFTRNKHYVFCGDSTFFHSEMSTLSNAIKDGQDILYIILDNKNTAMTGHQSTPASAYDVMGYKTIEQDIESVVRGMDALGRVFIRRVDPSERDSYMALLEDAFLMSGVRVVIADRECGITYHRKKRAMTLQVLNSRGFLPQQWHINITPEVCENCRECTLSTGCPGLTIARTPYGEKIAIDQSICVDDTYCTKVKACPSFEKVIITRTQPPEPRTGKWDLWMRDIPAVTPPALLRDDGIAPRTFNIFVPGVGGMGLGFVAKILTEAGAREGYTVNYYHQKGLAQRNGAVVSHVIWSADGARVSQRIPDGKADFVLGLDYLESVRGLTFFHRDRTSAVVNTAETPTIKMLMGEDGFPRGLEERLRAHAREGGFLAADYFHLAEHYFGNRVYANLMMLGTAWQRAMLPVRAETIEAVILESVKQSERENNLRAFRIGRRLASHPEMLVPAGHVPTSAEVRADKTALLARQGRRLADAYIAAMDRWCTQLAALSDAALADFVRRYADLLQFEDEAYAERYAARVAEVYAHERAAGECGLHPATQAVIWNLHKVMAIKDEVWVAHLLTSEEKLRADRERYDIDPARGDRIRYLHINRPHFELFGRSFEWDMHTRNWMLHVMKRLKVLRRLLPAWHAKEKAFRDWYAGEVIGAYLASRFGSTDDALAALGLPYTCTGYREVVYPKHERARRTFAGLVAGTGGAAHPSTH